MWDRAKMRQCRSEISFLLGRFSTEHLARTYAAFDGDLTAALVLGAVGQYNYQRFYDEVLSKADNSTALRIQDDPSTLLPRPCNVMSVSYYTGIPRETVRRKVRWLIRKGWIKCIGRDKHVVTDAVSRHFADYNYQSLERFLESSKQIESLTHRRGGD